MSVEDIAREVAQEVERQRAAVAGSPAPRPMHRLDTNAALQGIWKHRTYVLVATLALTAGIACLVLLMPARYQATVVILPPANRTVPPGLGNLAGVASNLGLDLMGTPTGYEQYPAIVKSRRILEPIVRSGVVTEKGVTLNTLEVLGIRGETESERTDRAIEALAERIVSARIDRKTQVLLMSATTGHPEFSAAVVNAIAAGLDAFNREQTNLSAADRRLFVEGRLAEVRAALETAEDELRAFRERNRLAQSPLTQVQESRLVRDVGMQTALFTELRKQLELEKIEELRNTTTVTILDRAPVPSRPSGPPRTRLIVLAGLLSALLSGFVAFGWELWNQDHVGSPRAA